jgi:peptide/nickel transport system permease protein
MNRTLTAQPIVQIEHPRAPSFGFRFVRNPQAFLGLILVCLMLFMAFGADFISSYDPTRLSPRDRFIAPGAEHLFGTDHLGRDTFTRMIYGARISLSVGLAAVTLSAVIGTLLGAVAGYFGGWADIIISRLVDTFLAIPGLVLTIGLVSILGSGLDKMVLAIGISSWPLYARLVRGSYMTLKELEYVEAARSIGARTPRIILWHMLPNAVGPILVVMTIGTAGAILTEAGLSFLGIGLEPKIPTWGRMLAEAQEFIRQYPYLSVFPGIGIMLFTLGFNLFGEGLRDLLDPKIRKR